jgi:hypothetical protein
MFLPVSWSSGLVQGKAVRDPRDDKINILIFQDSNAWRLRAFVVKNKGIKGRNNAG